MNHRYILIAAAGLAAAACAGDPYYSQPGYATSGQYYNSRVADYYDDGRVVAIDVIGGAGRSTGAGAVIGGIVGGVLGHQVGSGRGNDVATAAGAIGGAVAGNEIEKRRNDEQYRVTVELRDGRTASFMQDSPNGLRVGDRVRLADNRLYRE